MKLRVLFVLCVLVGVSTSIALAAPPAGKGPPPGKGPDKGLSAGKGKPPTTGVGCRPQVMVVLRGTLAATPGATATSITVNVTKANKHGALYVAGSQPVTILVVAATKISRQGQKTLAALVQGDRVLVQARACKADLAAATPQLTAKHIVAHPLKAGALSGNSSGSGD